MRAIFAVLFTILSISISASISASASAGNIVEVTCERASNAGRPDALKKIKYLINTDASPATSSLDCSEKIDHGFCAGIRMAQSTLFPTSEDRKCSQGVRRIKFHFRLAEEDARDEEVSFNFFRSCKDDSLLVPAELYAVVSSYYSNEFDIISNVVVKCVTAPVNTSKQ